MIVSFRPAPVVGKVSAASLVFQVRPLSSAVLLGDRTLGRVTTMWRACERGRRRTITEGFVTLWSLICSSIHIRCVCYLSYTEERRGGGQVWRRKGLVVVAGGNAYAVDVCPIYSNR